ncbi:MAG TPA: SDR family NAD(P)-dependent oxidoreductase [Patescibacteria group bacterium]|nr:SDR family NAD(P)-dependent oxidoreductase [Patescibacteria group bacterium]
MKNIKDSRIWIIGASSGIGRALAKELAARGAIIVLSARDSVALIDLKAELGVQHAVFPLDVTDDESVADVAETVTDSGRIDSVIFMAGQYKPGAVAEMDLDTAHMIVEVNLNGALNVVNAILPRMIEQKAGQIALCGSVAGYCGLPRGQPYSATKAALINFAESLRTEVAGSGIDVKIINPGFVHTPMTDQNDFKMPMVIETDEAARAIADGLTRSAFEIHFPKRFTFLMKVLRLLPAALYFPLAARMDQPVKKLN